MKKKIFAIFTALTCMMTAITATSSSAESVDTSITITSDNFVYTNKCMDASKNQRAFYLESELISPDVMIVGIIEHTDSDGSKTLEYIGSLINKGYINQARVISRTVDFGDLGEKELKVGDLLQCDSDRIPVAEEIPPFFAVQWNYLGNGIDIFGEDFEDVIRWEMVFWDTDNQLEYIERYDYQIVRFNEHYSINLVKGDVTVDDKVNILDGIAINKSLLAGAPLCDYAKLAGDVNENGAIDADDSLMILKETIGLTENFE